MIIFDGPVTPDASTAFVRRVPTPSALSLLAAVPRTQSFSNKFDWSEVLQTNRTARFRSFDGRIHVSERDGGQDKQVNLLPLSDSLNMGEYERIQLEFARTGGTRQQALANAVYNDAQRLTFNALNRLEQAIGDVLIDGKLTINENGFQGEADFGVPSEHMPTAATVWSNPDAKILSDIQTWVDVFVATNGYAPTRVQTSRKVRRFMLSNKEIVAAAIGTQMGRTDVTLSELTAVLETRGLPGVVETYDTVLNVDGAVTRVVPEDRFILSTGINQLIELRFGVSATALELVNSTASDMKFEESPGLVGVIGKVGPPYRQFTFIDGVVMPILRDARQLMVGKVL